MLVWVKLLALVPAILTPLIVSVAVPVLLSVTVFAALLVLTGTEPNASEVGERLTAGAAVDVPVPDRLTVCGLPVALSVIVIAADRAPAAVGLNVALIVHAAPAATVPPHVVVAVKSALLVPVTAMLLIVRAPPPVLVSVTDEGALGVPISSVPNASEVAERPTAGVVDVTPVPLSGIEWGLPVALSVMTSDALLAPVAVGLKVAVRVQFAPAANVLPHVANAHPKSALLVPLRTALLKVIVEAPELLSVMVCAALVVPTTWLAKTTEAGLMPRVRLAAVPLPERAMLCGLPVALSVRRNEALRAPAALGRNVRVRLAACPRRKVVGAVADGPTEVAAVGADNRTRAEGQCRRARVGQRHLCGARRTHGLVGERYGRRSDGKGLTRGCAATGRQDARRTCVFSERRDARRSQQRRPATPGANQAARATVPLFARSRGTSMSDCWSLGAASSPDYRFRYRQRLRRHKWPPADGRPDAPYAAPSSARHVRRFSTYAGSAPGAVRASPQDGKRHPNKGS